MDPVLRQRYFVGSLSSGENSVADADIVAINKLHPLQTVNPDEIFVRRMIVLGTEPTSKLSIHPEGERKGKKYSVLTDLSKTLVGCSMMEGHDLTKTPWGRIFEATVCDYDGYIGKVLKIGYYFLKIDDGERRAARIDAGIDSECSVSYRFSTARCSICDTPLMIKKFMGIEMREMKCSHVLGRETAGEICYWYPDGVVGWEVSMVFKGAYPLTRSVLGWSPSVESKELIETYGVSDNAAAELALTDAIISTFSGGVDGEKGDSGNVENDGNKGGNSGDSGNNDSGQRTTGSDGLIDWGKIDAFCRPVKPLKSGVANNEFFELSDFKMMDGKYYVDGKYDGVFACLIKHSGKVRLVTDSMTDHTDKFPAIASEAEKMSIDDFILHGEIVRYRGRKRGTHTDVTAYLVSSGPFEDYGFRYKPFDIAVFGGKNLCNEKLPVRRDAMKSIKRGEKIHPVAYSVVEGGEAIVKAIEAIATREGAVIKSVEMTLTPEGRKDLWKWKRQLEIDVLVSAVDEKTEKSFIYTCDVGTGDERTSIGKTYLTGVVCPVGGILTVSVDSVTYDEAEKKFTWYAPKVVSRREDKCEPDPLSVLKRIADVKELKSRLFSLSLFGVLSSLNSCRLGVDIYLCGGYVSRGTSTHDIDLLTTSPLSESDKAAICEAFGDFAQYIDFIVNTSGPDGNHLKFLAAASAGGSAELAGGYSKKFVLQKHLWGQASHYDLRFGSPDGKKMWGFTCFNAPSKVAGGPKVRCEEKDYHDVRWMDFEGEIKPGNPGNPTKNLVANMEILDKGNYEFVKRTPDFLEVVLHGNEYSGRYVFRKIEVKDVSGKKSVDGDEAGGKGTIWILWKPLDQTSGNAVGVIKHSFLHDTLMFWEDDSSAPKRS